MTSACELNEPLRSGSHGTGPKGLSPESSGCVWLFRKPARISRQPRRRLGPEEQGRGSGASAAALTPFPRPPGAPALRRASRAVRALRW